MNIDDIKENMTPRDHKVASLYVDMVLLVRQYDRVNELFDELFKNGDEK